MMMGASGLSRLISIANSYPFISGMDKHSAQTGQLLARWGMLHVVKDHQVQEQQGSPFEG
jgi:hypothetical protein